MRELLDKIETRQLLIRETAEQLREQIARIAEQLTAAEATLRRLEITRETIVELAAEDGVPPPEPPPPGHRPATVRFWPSSRMLEKFVTTESAPVPHS
ncbi:hypothetical protein GCM10010211_73730 [Streptomyces albospinus]|uniref:Uncharacterized protein n=1 Tax=Streptomyces albospinus TaxID=285515 RepID=A0ABQ2VPE7_9ACTN|nr:hypothetical protein [Streptomyces albospinus]GGU95874.1 hypothetical protein GCM10010211_73730 [Streptomyces albospinus]